ncbi:MAG: filamentous hemagglutinin family protein [Dehalococcoidia bacterium]
MSYPWSAKTNTRTLRKYGAARLTARPPRRKSLARWVMLTLGGVILSAGTPPVSAAPPSPPPPAPNALPDPASNWIGSTGTIASHATVGNTMTVTQQSQNAILNWNSFNVGSAAWVNFNQTYGASATALNRINAANGPSQIFGRLTANGQIYLINQNGIIFGRGAQVNVGALVASTLDISDEVFNKGILSAVDARKQNPAFQGSGGYITIEDGAKIESAAGGRIMILSPEIVNGGEIRAPDGQAVLAAGQKVYVTASNDPQLRGLLVEVDSGGSVRNLGQVIAERGNVSLIGLAVNQDGLVQATTSVQANGSIQLVARDTISFDTSKLSTSTNPMTAQRTGSVEFGAGSVTEVLPDTTSSATTVDTVKQPPSRVDVMGKQIRMAGGSRITVKGGQVNLTAMANPLSDQRALNQGVPVPYDGNARIQLEAGSRVDVSGNDVVLPMERNTLTVEVRGAQLADVPQQRGGVLQGRTVNVDLRQGTPLLNISGAVANIPRTVAERTATGGTVNISSTGDVRFLNGAAIDVSGGTATYLDGYVKTTKLMSAGRIYDIGQADPNRHYDGIVGSYTLTDPKWGVTRTWNFAGSRGTFVPGYVEGKNAGTAAFAAPGMVLDGTLLGRSVVGPYQRDAAHLPQGGKLIVGSAPLPIVGVHDYRAPNIDFRSDRLTTALDFTQPLPDALRDRIELSTQYLTEGGFTRSAIYSNGRIGVPRDTPIRIAPGAKQTTADNKTVYTSSFALTGREIDVASDIQAPGAAVNLKVDTNIVNTPDTARLSVPHPGTLSVADGVTISTRGVWTNDVLDTAASQPVAVDGGSISLHSDDNMILEYGVSLDVSSGGWLQSNGKLVAGNGGNITLDSLNLDLRGNLNLRGEALGKGGHLTVNTRSVILDGAEDDASLQAQQQLWNSRQIVKAGKSLRLPAYLFQRGGFSRYTVSAKPIDKSDSGLTVAADALIRPRMDNWILDSDFRSRASGTRMQDLAQVGFLPDDQRLPANLDLNMQLPQPVSGAVPKDFGLVVASGARISTDPGAEITLVSNGQLFIDGRIDAPAGKINLTLDANNTNQAFDPGQMLWLGPSAVLDASGTLVLKPNSYGLRQGDVLSGGQVSLTGKGVYVVTAAGSRIDVSGASAQLDLPGATGSGPVRTTVASAAGSIAIQSSEGGVLDGEMRADSAPVAGAAGGSLNVTVDSGLRNDVRYDTSRNPRGYPASDSSIILGQTKQLLLPVGFKAGDNLLDSASYRYSGKFYLAADRIQISGFDQLNLKAVTQIPDTFARIEFPGTVKFALRRSIQLDAPILSNTGADASVIDLSASYVALGSTNQAGAPASGGPGRLTVHGKLVDLIQNTTLQGFHDTRIVSDGDIRLRGGASGTGSFNAAGKMTLQADQVYPTTFTQFTVQAKDIVDAQGNVIEPGTIAIQPNPSGIHSQPVLSAAGKVILNATNITQAGVLKAPFGQIELNATRNLTLAGGSITSTSSENRVIPFGRTENTDWVYGPTGTACNIFCDQTQNVPTKRVVLNGDTVEIKNGARIDLSGGGDLLAYEWLPGPGGSKDALAPQYTNGNTYAILPGLGNGYAPYDGVEYAGVSLQPGDSVHLAGGGGLPTGDYTLLPARYALLPGAYLVTAAKGYQDLPAGQRASLVDGTPVVSGYRTVAGTAIRDSRSSGFAVRPGSYAGQLAEYKLSRANDFIAARSAVLAIAAPRLPSDAGTLAIRGTSAIDLGGALAAASDHGRGARVDIEATRLAVVANPGDAGGYVELEASKLNALGAESLLLGGRRRDTSNGTDVDVSANDVLVVPHAQLQAPDLILASSDKLKVGANAVLNGTGATAPNAAPETLLLHGDGALLRVSAGPQAHVVRAGEQGLNGTLTVDAGALLKADRSVILDASKDTLSQGQIVMNGGSLNLGASRISLGDTAGLALQGLALSNAALAQLKVDELVLTSRSSVDLLGNVNLNFQNLAVEAGGLAGRNSTANTTATISAGGNITLSNPGKVAFSETLPQGGNLQLSADRIHLGQGDFAIQGYSNVNLNAAKDIVTEGKGTLSIAADRLTLQSSRITGTTGADHTIDASGRVSITTPATVAAGQMTDALGARLNIIAQNITDAGHIEQHSGTVSLHARGAQSGDGVTLGAGAVIDVSGIDKQFADLPLGTPGGRVELHTDNGNVVIAAADPLSGNAAARINVAGGTAGGDAGSIIVSATQGTADIGGNLQASANAGAQAGSFTLDAQNLNSSGLAGLNDLLNAGRFNETRSLRLRQGDVAIGAGTEVTAHRFHLTADRGRIDVGGTIDAAGEKGGEVVLSAAGDIALAAGAQVKANATGAGQHGGSVDLRTTTGGVQIAAGAGIDVSAGPAGADGVAGAGGTVGLRLPRTAALTLADQDSTNDRLRVDGNIVGGTTTVEAFKTYISDSGIVGANDVSTTGTWFTEAGSFINNAATIVANLGKTGDSGFHVVPGIEVDSNADLTLPQTQPWDLSTWRFGLNNEPGVLTLRAKGDLNLSGSLSDGFNGVSPSSALRNDRSWSYRLVGGADTGSADVLALSPVTALPTDAQGNIKGSVNLASGQLVRTGTGKIDIAAGHNVTLGDANSVIYTAGVPSGHELDSGKKVPSKYLLTRGGNLNIVAQGDVIGPGAVDGKTQLINEWLQQQPAKPGNIFQPAELAGWWINFGGFQQNLAAFGGGDLRIDAGGNITRLSASVPTTGYYDAPAQRTVTVGGGDLAVSAAGDLARGIFFVGRGTGTVRAGGALTSARQSGGSPLYTVLAVMDGKFDVQSRGDLVLTSVINPTLTPLGQSPRIYFPSYSADSAVSLRSLAGNLELRNNADDITANMARLSNFGTNGSDIQTSAGLYPGTLTAVADGGDISVDGPLILYPVPRGNLQLLANGSMRVAKSLLVSDADAGLLPSLNASASNISEIFGNPLSYQLNDPFKTLHAASPVHLGDAAPIRIVALTGDVSGVESQAWNFSKAAWIQAGHDIRSLHLFGQNANGTDVTRLEAGRDIVQPLQDNVISVGGPGRLEISAGRHIDLGPSKGIETTGSVKNPALPNQGADVTVTVGSAQAPAYATFDAAYRAMSDSTDARAKTIGEFYVRGLVDYVRKLKGDAKLTPADALAAFDALPPAQRQYAILLEFYNELGAAGREANNPGIHSYQRGFDAIKTLFPEGVAYAGDLSLFFSKIYTLSGGDINLLVPGGLINAGLASAPANAPAKTASELGIVAQGTGSVRAFVRDDFLVNQSRVFTLQGGDILMWSSRGNIDAGRGAKTAISAPPPKFHISAEGNVTFDTASAVAGSGIRTITTGQGVSPGNVNLIAPAGAVNAGDAGIGAAGNLNIAAARVVGADNIQVGGIATGVPVVDTGGLSAGLVGAGNVAGSVAKSTDDAVKSLTDNNAGGLSFLDVQVTGFGGDQGGEAVDLRKRKKEP